MNEVKLHFTEEPSLALIPTWVKGWVEHISHRNGKGDVIHQTSENKGYVADNWKPRYTEDSAATIADRHYAVPLVRDFMTVTDFVAAWYSVQEIKQTQARANDRTVMFMDMLKTRLEAYTALGLPYKPLIVVARDEAMAKTQQLIDAMRFTSKPTLMTDAIYQMFDELKGGRTQ